MKVMLLVMDDQRVILDRLYEMIRLNCQACEVFRLSRAQQLNLGAYLSNTNYHT